MGWFECRQDLPVILHYHHDHHRRDDYHRPSRIGATVGVASRPGRGIGHAVMLAIVFVVSMGCGAAPLGAPKVWVPWEQADDWLTVELVDPPVPQLAQESLRIVTFNVHYGEDVAAIAAAFLDNSVLATADVILLQEIRSYPAEGSSRAARLAAALGMGYAYAPAKRVGEGTHGLAIVSRFALENVATMELPRAEIRGSSERRMALAADIATPSGPLRVINVHLDTRLNAPDRILQLRPAVLDAPERAVAAGDFNSNPLLWAANTVPLLPAGTLGVADQAAVLDDYMFGLKFFNPTAPLGATVDFPVLDPHLDSVYIRAVTSEAASIERSVGVSDHWPVCVDILVGPARPAQP